MAGGITGCPDWQQDIRRMLDDLPGVVLLNPRQADFPIEDPSAAAAQIKWEFDHFLMAGAAMFWFPKETLCPIVLYELGMWAPTMARVWIGIHPEYCRRQDVEMQTDLRGLEVEIVYSLEALAGQINEAVRSDGGG